MRWFPRTAITDEEHLVILRHSTEKLLTRMEAAVTQLEQQVERLIELEIEDGDRGR